MDTQQFEYSVKRLAKILSVQAEIEGMKAFNKQREIQGDSVGYNKDAFDQLAYQLEILSVCHNDQL
jgi:hypothetical protein